MITADRGLAGAYSINAIREGEGLTTLLKKERGFEEVIPYVVGRKGVGYYNFREREMGGEWVGFSDQPDYAHARETPTSCWSGSWNGPRTVARTRSTSSTRTS